MQLKYVGPKPLISHTGIDFDNNKEDKFVYLNIAVQLLKALDHEYFEDKTYIYHADTDRLSENELINVISKYSPDLKILLEKRNHRVEDEIEHDIERARQNTLLSEEEKKTLQNNIEIMHDYLVQRSINKTAYYCAIDVLAAMVKKDNIDYIITPLYERFAHVLHSIQGSLRRQKFPIDSKMEVFSKDGELHVKLDVINRV